MKHVLTGLMFILILVSTAIAAANEDITEHKSCTICGMDRATFAQSRMLIEYDPEHIVGTCSIRCAALDLAMNMGRVPTSIRVADFDTLQLIDAEKAVWVIGGKKVGVMATRGKWAFSSRAAAVKFKKTNNGAPGSFQDVLKAAFADLYSDLMLFWKSMRKGSSPD